MIINDVTIYIIIPPMSEQFPLVTVVTPSYNQAEYLEQTIASVLGQDYPNIEYFVVDGGSTDGSLEIIRKYAGQLDWWVSEPDNGQADAINKGFRRAKGKYIAWLNSDDLYLPGTIRKAVEVLEGDPELGIVYADLLSINARGEHVNTIRYRPFGLEDLLSFSIIGQPTVFMRRSVQQQAGLLSEEYHFLLDIHLWLRMAAISRLKYVPEPWAAARYHPAAKNMSQAGRFGDEAARILDWAKTQPKMADLIASSEKRVLGGLHRFQARYLLDAGREGKALLEYARVLVTYPEFALQRYKQILLSLLGFLSFGLARKAAYRRYYVQPDPTSSGLKMADIIFPQREETPKTTFPPILVTGAHRSATTWIGKMLAANPAYAYVSEPLNVLHRRGVMRKPVARWYHYICRENEEQLLSAFYETLALQYHPFLELADLRSPRDVGRMLRDWRAFNAGRKAGQQVLLKDPFAVFSADWFHDRLGCEVVILVRHPAAYVSSLKRLDWDFQFEDLLAQPLLMQDWLEPFRAEIEKMVQQGGDIIEQGSLLWRLVYHTVWQMKQRHPGFHLVRHEDASLDPLGTFRGLYQSLGIPFSEETEAAILESSAPSNQSELSMDAIHSVNLDSRSNLSNWQKRMTAAEIDRVYELTKDVWPKYYTEDDWK